MARTVRNLCLLFALSLTLAAPVQAAAGELDLTFAGFQSGKIRNAPLDVIEDLALQPDGKIVIAGSKDGRFGVARYHPDGALDLTFNGVGWRETKVYSAEDSSHARAVTIQSDGKIVVAGQTVIANNSNFALARFNSDGSLDNTFSGNGLAYSDFDGGHDVAHAVAIQPTDGKIVVAGVALNTVSGGNSHDEFGLARYNTDGTLDSSFSGNGKTFVDFGSHETALALVIQPNGQILVGGYHTDCALPCSRTWSLGGAFIECPFIADAEFALARLNQTDGSLDGSFGSGGKVVFPVAGSDCAYALAVRSGGDIVAAGVTLNVNTGDPQGFALARFTANGTPDSTFSGNGKTLISIGDGGARSLVVQADGKMVAAGTGLNFFALVRVLNDGSLDNTFGGFGKVYSDFDPGREVIAALQLQPDGRLVAAGQRNLIRYFPDGSVDIGGKQTLAFYEPADDDGALAVALQDDGRMVVAGYSGPTVTPGPRPGFAVARLRPDGALDPTFRVVGHVENYLGPINRATSVAIQPDGRIVLGGYFQPTPSADEDFALLRLSQAGVPDVYCGGGSGHQSADFNGGDDRATALAIQQNGKLLLAGTVETASGSGVKDIGIARFNSDCTLDGTFSGGKVQVPISGDQILSGIVAQPNGKIVIAAWTGLSTTNSDILFVRLNADGTLDGTFGVGGKRVSDLGGNELPRAMKRQADGKLLVAGGRGPTGNFVSYDFLVARYRPDGTLDAGFGQGGWTSINMGDTDVAEALDVRADGTIALAGTNGISFAIAQFRSDGRPDTRFNGSGTQTADFGGLISYARGIAFSGQDRLLAVGVQVASGSENMALAQFLTAPMRQQFLPLIRR